MERGHPQPEHLKFVDGLRAVAVLAVVVFHVSAHSAAQTTKAMVLLYQGMHGVELFFVISGFCLAYPTLVRLHGGQSSHFDVIRYAARRLVRIFPPFLAALAILTALAFVPAWNGSVTATGVSGSHFTLLEALKEAALLDRGPLHNKSFWSLAIELRWYAIFPLALALFIKAPRAIIAICGLSWLLYYQSSAAAADMLELPAFLLGIVAADAYIRRPSWLRFAPYIMLAAASLGLAYQAYDRAPYWEIAAFGVVLCAIWSERTRRLLSWAPLLFIGTASYSIYLVHEPIIAWARSEGVSPLTAGALAVGCGIVFWALVERSIMLPDVHRRLVAAVQQGIVRCVAWIQGTGRANTGTAAEPPGLATGAAEPSRANA